MYAVPLAAFALAARHGLKYEQVIGIAVATVAACAIAITFLRQPIQLSAATYAATTTICAFGLVAITSTPMPMLLNLVGMIGAILVYLYGNRIFGKLRDDLKLDHRHGWPVTFAFWGQSLGAMVVADLYKAKYPVFAVAVAFAGLGMIIGAHLYAARLKPLAESEKTKT